MKPLFIPLNGVYYDAFESGKKHYELRPYGKRWNEKVCATGRRVVLSRGYGKARRLNGVIIGFAETPLWNLPEGDQQDVRSIYDDSVVSLAQIYIKAERK